MAPLAQQNWHHDKSRVSSDFFPGQNYYDTFCECGNAYGETGEGYSGCSSKCDGDYSVYSCGGDFDNEIYDIVGKLDCYSPVGWCL